MAEKKLRHTHNLLVRDNPAPQQHAAKPQFLAFVQYRFMQYRLQQNCSLTDSHPNTEPDPSLDR